MGWEFVENGEICVWDCLFVRLGFFSICRFGLSFGSWMVLLLVLVVCNVMVLVLGIW